MSFGYHKGTKVSDHNLMDCDLELFTFADNFIRGFKHMKHCFLVNSALLLPFCSTLALVCIKLGTGLEIP